MAKKPAQLRKPKKAAQRNRGMSLDALFGGAVQDIAKTLADPRRSPFAPGSIPMPPPGVLPKGHDSKRTLAMDSQVLQTNTWAVGQLQNAALLNGVIFLGFPYLSELAQIAEYRAIAEVTATEMTREWIEFKSTSTDKASKAERIKQLTEEFKRLDVQGAFRRCAELDLYFGRSHLYLDTGATDDFEELKTSIGDGRNATTESKAKGARGFLKALRPVEPIWAYPAEYTSNNPLKPDWYNPQSWFVLGNQIHVTRLLTFVGREVPDMLKPSYMFGGLPMSQMVRPTVDNWLRARKSVSDLLYKFSANVLKTSMDASTTEGGVKMLTRARLMSQFLNNNGILMLDKNAEDFVNVAAPLGSLDHLQAQAQEHQCLTGDTLIETDRGQVPIRDVCVTDKVMTRAGWAPLAWSGITGYADELVEIQTANSTIRATPCHPIWLPQIQEFVRAWNVKVGDLLLEAPTWQTNMASPRFGAAVGGASLAPATTATSKLADYCTAKFGKPIAALFQKISSFITSMATAQTISSTILSFAPSPIIAATISTAAVSASIATRQSIGDNARSAARITRPSWRVGVFRSIAAALARLKPTSFVAAGLRPFMPSSVSIAGRASSPSDAMRDSVRGPACSAPVLRVSVVNAPRQPVYNLEIASGHLPEFFANGVLTHNSAVSHIPLVKLTGISPSGLNATSEFEMQAWYEWVRASQVKLFTKHLNSVACFAMISLWGEVDPEIVWEFKPLKALSAKELVDLQKTKAETAQLYIASGTITPEDDRRRLSSDPDSPYDGLDLADEDDGGAEELVDGNLSRMFPRVNGGREDRRDDDDTGRRDEPGQREPRPDRNRGSRAREPREFN